MKKLFNLLAASLLVLSLFSCATTKVEQQPATITKHENSMLWELNGIDKKGNPSKLYVLGTIHVGDSRLYPLPAVVENAMAESDTFVSEIAMADYSKLMQLSMERQLESQKREAARIAETGKKYTDYLSEEQYNTILQYLGNNKMMIDQLTTFEPWILTQGLSSVPLAESKLDPTMGIDATILNKCTMEGIDVKGLEPVNVQLDILEFGDWETQLQMLKDTLDDFIEEGDNLGADVIELYEAYLTFDENAVANVIAKQLAENTTDYSEEYNKVVFIDRNTLWANKFAELLNNGGTTFVFAGSGHFVGENSVFNIMKSNNSLSE